MGKVIVITSGHGGVGKTTVTAYLGTALALIGKTVVVVDADTGLRCRNPEILSRTGYRDLGLHHPNLDTVMYLEATRRVVVDEYTAMDVHQKGKSLQSVLVKSFQHKRQSVSKLLEKYIDERLSELRFLVTTPANSEESLPPAQMKAICDELRAAYDFVLIDTPAGLDSDFPQAAAGAEEALVITTPEMRSVRSTDSVITFLSTLQVKVHLIINRVSPMMLKNEKVHLIINRMLPMMLKNKRAIYQIDPRDVACLLNLDPLGVVPEAESFLGARGEYPLVHMMKSPTISQAYLRIANRLTDM